MVPMRSRHGKGVALAAMVLLMAGCGDGSGSGSGSDGDGDSGVEPTTFAVVADAADFDSTRTEVADTFGKAASLADQALGGEGVRGETTVSDTLCNEAYPRRFSRLEGGATLKAPGDSLAGALRKVADAWTQPGWKVEVAEPDGVLLSAKTSTGVPFSVEATLQVNQTDPVTIGAGLSAQTRCLKLPQDVADGL
jgi:hypothetical protein